MDHSYSNCCHKLHPEMYLEIDDFKVDYENSNKLLKSILGG